MKKVHLGHSSANTYGREPCSSGLQTQCQQNCSSPFKPAEKLFLSRWYENTPYEDVLSYYTECFSWSQRQNKDQKKKKKIQKLSVICQIQPSTFIQLIGKKKSIKKKLGQSESQGN